MKSISVIMATLNSEKTLKKCLKSVREQEYNQDKIEIIIADGGSTDKTIEIAKQYQTKIIPENTGSPEAAKAVALRQAKNELILQIDDDNILPNKKWLAKMVSLLDKETNIVGCYPWRYTYQKRDKILNRYFSLFGVNDPIAYFLNKADRQSYLSLKWTLSGKATDKGEYFLVEFDKENLSTVGANGFLIKKNLLMRANVDKKHFFHIDVNYDLIKKGYNKYVVVKNDIIHASGENFFKYLKKRQKYMNNLYLHDLLQRRYLIYNPQKDKIKIIVYSIYALTWIGPIIEALKGFVKIPDPAWFLHPIICFSIFWIYSLNTIKYIFKNILKNLIY